MPNKLGENNYFNENQNENEKVNDNENYWRLNILDSGLVWQEYMSIISIELKYLFKTIRKLGTEKNV